MKTQKGKQDEGRTQVKKNKRKRGKSNRPVENWLDGKSLRQIGNENKKRDEAAAAEERRQREQAEQIEEEHCLFLSRMNEKFQRYLSALKKAIEHGAPYRLPEQADDYAWLAAKLREKLKDNDSVVWRYVDNGIVFYPR